MAKEYIEREAAVKAAQDGADEWDGGYNRNRDLYIEAAIDKIPAYMDWVPVGLRMPESGMHVLVCCRFKYVSGEGGMYVCDAFHTDPKTIPCEYSDDIDADYDEETDEFYFPEGWWEVIKNWDDYSAVAICDTVTHWMPLPSTEGLDET